MDILILALVFLAIVALVVGSYQFLNRRRLTAAAAARGQLHGTGPLRVEQQPTRSILKDQSVSALPQLERLLAGASFTAGLSTDLQRAGSTQKPGAFVLMCGVFGMAGLLLGSMIGGPLFAAVGALVGLVAPYLNLKRLRRKRLKAFEEQLPEAIDMLVSAMRAGYSFQAAMRFIGEETAAPLGDEFAQFYDEQRLGMDVRVALLKMQDRMDSLELKMLITAILIQRETGGNLSEVLQNIAGLMRERAAMRGEFETLTAESKLSAKILAALPFLVFLGMNVLNGEFVRPMMTERAGQLMLLSAMVLIGVGYVVMMKIADIEI